jgi:hypothetical protein
LTSLYFNYNEVICFESLTFSSFNTLLMAFSSEFINYSSFTLHYFSVRVCFISVTFFSFANIWDSINFLRDYSWFFDDSFILTISFFNYSIVFSKRSLFFNNSFESCSICWSLRLIWLFKESIYISEFFCETNN